MRRIYNSFTEIRPIIDGSAFSSLVIHVHYDICALSYCAVFMILYVI